MILNTFQKGVTEFLFRKIFQLTQSLTHLLTHSLTNAFRQVQLDNC